MADYIVRVELHQADARDYELLHEKMEAKGYSKEIKGSSGKKFKLPLAEYETTKNKTAAEVRDEVVVIASSVKKNPGVLVTKCADIAWSLKVI